MFFECHKRNPPGTLFRRAVVTIDYIERYLKWDGALPGHEHK